MMCFILFFSSVSVGISQDPLFAKNPRLLTLRANGTYEIYLADLDHDGDQDIITSMEYYYRDQLAWFENSGLGVYGQENLISAVEPYKDIQRMTVADLDLDGFMDVIAVDKDKGHLIWHRNMKDSFSEAIIISTWADLMVSIETGDIDGDGDIDILFGQMNGDKVGWFKNEGSGVFIRRTISISINMIKEVRLSDIDGDGDLDVISASYTDNKIAFYKNNGTGSFEKQKIISTDAFRAIRLNIADLDGDGRPDVISSAQGDGQIAWYKNINGDSFSSKMIVDSLYMGAKDIEMVDIDLDGDVDILAAHQPTNQVLLYKNDSKGNFSSAIVLATRHKVELLYPADMDEDGDIDIIVGSDLDDEFVWLENLQNDQNVAGEIFYDINGSGKRDYFEPAILYGRATITPKNGTYSMNQIGKYSFQVDTGRYVVSYDSLSLKNWKFSDDSSSYTIQVDKGVKHNRLDFGFRPKYLKSQFKLESHAASPICGKSSSMTFSIYNSGTTYSNGVLWITLDPQIAEYYFHLEPDTTSGKRFGWKYQYLYPSHRFEVSLDIKTPSYDGLKLKNIIESDYTDNLGQKTLHEELSYVVNCQTNSYYKSLEETDGENQGYAFREDFLNYSLEFQNTGTDTVRSVTLIDTLDPSLNPQSFHIVGSSHLRNLKAEQDGSVVRFFLDSIRLIDSASNFDQSRAYIRYRVKPKWSIKDSTIIDNTAHVKFDISSSYKTTNTVSVVVVHNPDLSVEDEELQFLIWPNPADEFIYIDADNWSDSKLIIYNQLGQIQYEAVLGNSSTQLYSHNWEAGVYFGLLSHPDGRSSWKKLLISHH